MAVAVRLASRRAVVRATEQAQVGRVAAVDIGSNSAHLLVADVDRRRLRPVAEETRFLGLGPTVDRHGLLGEVLRHRVVATVEEFVETSRTLGAGSVSLVGTEPLRRAADADRLVRDVRAATGVELTVVGHREEGLLAALGATGGRRPPVDLLVLDLGGGSMECVLLGPDRIPQAWAIRLGSVRLTARHVRHDPPSPDEIGAMRAEARRAMTGGRLVESAAVLATGGTAAALVRAIPEARLDHAVTRGRLERLLAGLADEPAASFARRRGIRRQRAEWLAAGALLMEAALDWYGHPRLYVSRAGLREGLALAMGRAGAGWRGRLERLGAGLAE